MSSFKSNENLLWYKICALNTKMMLFLYESPLKNGYKRNETHTSQNGYQFKILII